MLVSQGLTIDFTGSDEVDGPELHGNRDYDASRRWRSSEGVREVLSKGIAYHYADFCGRLQIELIICKIMML